MLRRGQPVFRSGAALPPHRCRNPGSERWRAWLGPMPRAVEVAPGVPAASHSVLTRGRLRCADPCRMPLGPAGAPPCPWKRQPGWLEPTGRVSLGTRSSGRQSCAPRTCCFRPMWRAGLGLAGSGCHRGGLGWALSSPWPWHPVEALRAPSDLCLELRSRILGPCRQRAQ